MEYINFIERHLIEKLVDTVSKEFGEINHTQEFWNKVFEKNRQRFQYYMKLVHNADGLYEGYLVDVQTLSVYSAITFNDYINKKMEVSNYRNSKQILEEFKRNMSDKESTFYKNMSCKYEWEIAEAVLKNRIIYYVTLYLDNKNGKYLSTEQELVINKMQNQMLYITPYLNYINSEEKIFDDDIENEVLLELKYKYEYMVNHIDYYSKLYQRRRDRFGK